jgi:cysteine synthase
MAAEMALDTDTYYMPYQYGNEANPLAHYTGTALEILEELDERRVADRLHDVPVATAAGTVLERREAHVS